MRLLDAIAGALHQPDVTEFAVAVGRVPCVIRGGALRAVGLPAATSDEVEEVLAAFGVADEAKRLGAQPVVLRAHSAAVGDTLVHMMRREGTLQFRVSRIGGARQAPPSHGEQGAAKPVGLTAAHMQERAAPHLSGAAASWQTADGPPPPMPEDGPARVPEQAAGRHAPERGAPRTLELELSRPLGDARAPASNQVPESSAPPPPRLAPAKSLELDAPAWELEGAPPPSWREPSRAPTRRTLDLDVPGPRVPNRSGRSTLAEAASGLELVAPSGAAGGAVRGTDAPALDGLLALARERGASDMHIIAGRPVLLRLAGELITIGEPLEPEAVEAICMAAVPARLTATLTDEGSCDFALGHPAHGRFRVNVSRQRTGLKASVRIISREVPTLESLALPLAIANALTHHQGLIVLTGPTGHGKSSTLAALVDRLNAETTRHVITVEDPVEHLHSRKRALISQREVGTHTRSFATALKAALREDPDVIVVGELRDTETVGMAIGASETGHLVLGTMNTPSAAKTIDRLIDLFPPGDQPQVRMTLAGGLRLIVSQRLLRSADGQQVFAAVEMLPGSVALWNLIREGKTYQIPSLQQRGKGLGIVRLDDSLADLVRARKVLIEDAMAVAEAPEELRARVAEGSGPS